jgi:hypothetical protein
VNPAIFLPMAAASSARALRASGVQQIRRAKATKNSLFMSYLLVWRHPELVPFRRRSAKNYSAPEHIGPRRFSLPNLCRRIK